MSGRTARPGDPGGSDPAGGGDGRHGGSGDGRLGIGGRSAHGNPNRGAIMHCPYCGGDDLWPDHETDYAWRCTGCCRVFTVKLHGHAPRDLAPAGRTRAGAVA